MTDEVETALSEYICREILKRPSYRLSRSDPLISSGLIDSFHLVDLALFIEEQYSVKIDDTELNADAFDSLAELAAMILQR